MKKIIFKGCGTAIITPFTEDGVNYDEFKKMIEFQIENGVDSIIVCGTTGEASTMTDEALVYQRGMDKEKLLDVDKKSYCDIYVKHRAYFENSLAASESSFISNILCSKKWATPKGILWIFPSSVLNFVTNDPRFVPNNTINFLKPFFNDIVTFKPLSSFSL